jgi:hypothetical protein
MSHYQLSPKCHGKDTVAVFLFSTICNRPESLRCRSLAYLILLVGMLSPMPRATTNNPFDDRQGASDRSAPSETEVRRAIELAAEYLERECDANGKFTYEVDIASGHKSSSYDIIRHAGAMYGLAMFNEKYPDPKAASAILRAARFMQQNKTTLGLVFAPDKLWFGQDH